MPHLRGRGAKKQIGEEAVPMGAHRYQIATLLFHPADDFLRWLAECQFDLRWNSQRLKLFLDALQVPSVFPISGLTAFGP